MSGRAIPVLMTFASRVQLIFDRVVTRKTPGEFRARVIQDGVHRSLHIQYKSFDLKQLSSAGIKPGVKQPPLSKEYS